MNEFRETLQSWQTFYFTAAGAAASLLGLMLVALSLGTGLLNKETREAMKTFVTPSVIYFVSAFTLALIMLVPAFTPPVLAGILGVGGLIGLIRTGQFAWRLIQAARQHQDFDLSDWLAQVIAPLLSWVLIVVSALLFALDQMALAFGVLWIGDLLLLLCAITNTWALVIWIIEQRIQ
jgi:hypothetical protein